MDDPWLWPALRFRQGRVRKERLKEHPDILGVETDEYWPRLIDEIYCIDVAVTRYLFQKDLRLRGQLVDRDLKTCQYCIVLIYE